MWIPTPEPVTSFLDMALEAVTNQSLDFVLAGLEAQWMVTDSAASSHSEMMSPASQRFKRSLMKEAVAWNLR